MKKYIDVHVISAVCDLLKWFFTNTIAAFFKCKPKRCDLSITFDEKYLKKRKYQFFLNYIFLRINIKNDTE